MWHVEQVFFNSYCIKIWCWAFWVWHVFKYDKDCSQKAKNSNLKVKLFNADVHHTPFSDECFDVLLSTNAIHHFDLIKSLKECARVLKKGGSYVVFSRFREQNDRSFWGKNFPKFAVKENRLYNREEFVDAVEKVENLI